MVVPCPICHRDWLTHSEREKETCAQAMWLAVAQMISKFNDALNVAVADLAKSMAEQLESLKSIEGVKE